ncbi:MAG: non-canonical purine NTP pyrophosphatase, partial [Leptospirales bacterium]
FQRMLDPLEIEVVSAADLGLDLDVAETADSFRGNAALKAREYFRQAGRPVIADDSGLAVDALSGAPGVYSARYGGVGLDDRGRRLHLLADLQKTGAGIESGNPAADLSARFICVLALCFGEAEPPLYFEGAAEGRILFEERGQGGFGYDPIFLDPDSGRSFAELAPEEKDARSHRGAALREFLRALEL